MTLHDPESRGKQGFSNSSAQRARNLALRPPTYLILSFAVASYVAFAWLARSLNRQIGYANSFNCDSWFFFGLQFNFTDSYGTGLYYQPYRFPALLPWVYLGNVIEYDWLNVIKFFTYFVLICSGILWATLRLYGLRVAVFVTTLFACSTSLLGALSHDYVTGAALAWITLYYASTIEAGRSRFFVVWSVISGVLLGACMYTHFSTAVFVLVAPLFFVVTARQRYSGWFVPLLAYLCGCLAGLIGLSILLGLYNESLGGTFLYVRSQIEIALQLLQVHDSTTGRIVGFGWLRTVGLVPLIGTMALAGLSLLLPISRLRDRESAAMAGLACVITSTLVFAWEFSGRILLQYNVYGPWVLPVLVLGIGGIVSRLEVVRTMQRRTYSIMVASVAGASLVAAITTRTLDSDARLFWWKSIAGLCLVATFVLFAKSKLGYVVLILLVGIVVMNYPTAYGSDPWYSGTDGRSMTEQAANALRILHRLDVEPTPKFWVGASEPEVIAVPRSFLQCGGFAGSFPDYAVGNDGWEQYFTALTSNGLVGARDLIVVAPGSHLRHEAVGALARLGLRARVVGEWPIGAGDLRTSLVLLRLEH